MTDLDKGVATPRGQGRSMTSLKPSNVNVSYGTGYPTSAPGQGADWFGPLQPMAPVAPPEVQGRQWDYPVGFNLNTTPRPYESVDFRTLRMLADAYDPVRLIIERRKDQMVRLPWTIRAKHEDGGKRPKTTQLSSQMRGTIKDVEAFFKRPSQGLSFRSWLRQLLEDLLVLDQPALYQARNSEGDLVALDLVDGGTLKPILTEQGRLPAPQRWDGSAFEWLGATVTPANFATFGFKIANGMLYPPLYVQILKGLPAVGYSSWDMLVRPLNLRTNTPFGRSPVEQIITTVNIAMRRSASQLEYFREGNQPAAIYGLPETWGPDQVQRFQDYFDSLYSGNLGNRRRMKFIPSGTNSRYTELHEPPLKNEFDEWLTRIVCFAFSYPPSAFVSLSNRSIAESHEKQAEEEGTEPLKLWFTDMANDVIESEFSEEVEFAWLEEEVVDQKDQAAVISTYVQNGIFSINEARQKLGEQPDPNPAANTLMAMTKTGFVPVGTPTEPATPTKDKQ